MILVASPVRKSGNKIFLPRKQLFFGVGEMTNGIEGKVIVITGASSGLGAAAARLLADEGGKLVLGARRVERIDSLARELAGKNGGAVLAVQTDVTHADQVRHLVDEAVAKFGRIDVMLNNAGLMPLSPLDRYKLDEWTAMIDVNIKGVLYGIAAALPHMQRQKSGHIINVASVAGHTWFPNGTVYCATKFAVRALSEGLRQEVKPYDIRTTIISPGAVVSELVDSISEQDLLAEIREASSIAIPADSFARMVAFAISQPDDVDVNEILFRPTRQQG
jgi:NADP-dependent 3-hydroxy acid dehydrogenase YdfG